MSLDDLGGSKVASEPKKQYIKLLTFNTWGLKFISNIEKRLRAIADALANPKSPDEDYDIVALQEIWCEEDWQYLDLVCRPRYPYRRVFKAGIVSGPGLAVLSKFPLLKLFFTDSPSMADHLHF